MAKWEDVASLVAYIERGGGKIIVDILQRCLFYQSAQCVIYYAGDGLAALVSLQRKALEASSLQSWRS